AAIARRATFSTSTGIASGPLFSASLAWASPPPLQPASNTAADNRPRARSGRIPGKIRFVCMDSARPLWCCSKVYHLCGCGHPPKVMVTPGDRFFDAGRDADVTAPVAVADAIARPRGMHVRCPPRPDPLTVGGAQAILARLRADGTSSPIPIPQAIQPPGL